MKKKWFEVWLIDTEWSVETLLAKVNSQGLAYAAKRAFAEIYKVQPNTRLEIR